MKFGSHLLEELQYPGWEEHYIRYKEIKKMIVHMKEERATGKAMQYDGMGINHSTVTSPIFIFIVHRLGEKFTFDFLPPL
jgi:hypothetical protein